MFSVKHIIFGLLLTGIQVSATAQKTSDKSSMVNERAQIQKEMNEIQVALKAVKGQTRVNISQLASLNRKIELQEKYINNIGKEIHLLDDDIYYSALEIRSLKNQLDTLRAHYARTVVYAYKNRSNYDYLNFIFSAGSFNDAIKRIAYLKSYRDYRQNQISDINKTRDLIASRYDRQLRLKGGKQKALVNRSDEYTVLEQQKKEKDSVITQLKSQTNDLQKQFAKKKLRDSELNSSIKSVIRKELAEAQRLVREDAKKRAAADARARAEALASQQREAERKALTNARERDIARAPEAPTSSEAAGEGVEMKPTNLPKPGKVTSGPTLRTRAVPTGTNRSLTASANPIRVETGARGVEDAAPAEPVAASKPTGGYLNYKPVDVSVNNSFAAHRGSLQAPVDGVITLGFGRYRIEGLGPDIVGDNPGVTYTAAVGSPVRAVFDGEVATISTVGGMSFIVLRHGKYFTAYSNLSSVNVSKGAIVARGQTLGRVGADEETGNGKLDFLLMIEDRNVDPRAWLGR
jgi:septal ring factor EnvC (AmiA/AmiB activator)